jgi:hypothetical protein
MTPKDQAFTRKIVYLVAIAVLLTAISLLGRPATKKTEQSQGSPGGVLAQQRTTHGLAQTDLGEIDPTSETIKLACLGMRGVATNVLWHKATKYKMKKDWTNLSAAVEQIIRVQPNFVSVWRFYGWTLAFNVSVEFDDFRERYHWVIKGIQFLKKGTRFNEHSPRLFWETGWTINQKIGRSDEKKQFRRLFSADDDFHGDEVVTRERDNWLVAREWYLRAEDRVDSYGDKMSGTSPAVFRSSAPMCLMKYAKAKEDEGFFGEVACSNWQRAKDYWVGNEQLNIKGFGQVDIPTTYQMHIQLNDQERLEEEAAKKAAELQALKPGLLEQMKQDRYDQLTDEQREAFDTPVKERTNEQHTLAEQARAAMDITHKELAKKIKGENRKKARELAGEATELEWRAKIIKRYRGIVNFLYWKNRAILEQEDDALLARKSIYLGDLAYDEPNPPKARKLYEQGLEAWRRVIDKHEDGSEDTFTLLDDTTFVDDLHDICGKYREILGQLEEKFPEPFILQDILDKHKIQ